MNAPPVQRTGIHDYLEQLPSILASSKDGSSNLLKLVICNESTDLDSTACTLTYAFFLHQTKVSADAVVLPVLNVARKDFPLRSDVVTLLLHYQINIDSLVFIEDVSFLKGKSDNLQVVLVDHNYPSDGLEWLISSVVQVIDHHEKLCKSVPLKNCSQWSIEKVGSCSTLVAEDIAKHGDGCYKIDSTSSALLLAAILVDTVCGSPAAGRETVRDADAVAKLDETAHLPFNHGRFFEWLMTAKFDVSRLSTADLLRKDAKLVTVGQQRVMMCSIPAGFQSIVNRNDLGSSLEQVLVSSSSSAVVIMCLSYANPAYPEDAKREIGVYSVDSELLIQLASWFQSNRKVDLALTPYENGSSGRVELISGNSHDDSGTTSPIFVNVILSDRMIAFTQGNVRASRKQVLPLVEEFLQNRASGEN